MDLEHQLTICSEHYKKWKGVALTANNVEEVRKALKRAFFWVELQSAFIMLQAIERVAGDEKGVKEKLLIAKSNLSKKLMEYAKEILNEI